MTASVRRYAIWRLGVAFALGCGAALAGFMLGIPGSGEFVPAIWSAGFAALFIAPGWPGLVSLIAGAAVSAAVIHISDGTFGLVVIIVAVVAAVALHGALSASVVLRLKALGWSRGLRDGQIKRSFLRLRDLGNAGDTVALDGGGALLDLVAPIALDQGYLQPLT